MRLFILLFFFVFGWAANAESAVSSLVADTSSGLIYESKNASVRQYPASLTKVMTLYLTFNALENGLLKMDDRLPISAHAAKQPRSKMFLKRGDTIRVKDAVMALIIKSANDAAVVLAEALAPSEADFAKMMTEVAHQLGLKNTQFRNASGLHHPEQVTTARDMAVLTIALINHFPQYYKLFSKENFWYRGKEYKTHNRVTQKYAGAEGLKTGYVAAVGYNIISTAKRKNNRLVSVVIGQKTGAIRDKQVMGLLDRGFTATQKPRSVLQKLKNQGKYASLNNSVQKPNMTKYLKIMQKRLASTKKQSDSVAKARINTLSKPKTVAQAKAPVEEEIEQGDNNQEESEAPQAAVVAEKPIESAEKATPPTVETTKAAESAAEQKKELPVAQTPPPEASETPASTEPAAVPATPESTLPAPTQAPEVPAAPESTLPAPAAPESTLPAPTQAPAAPETTVTQTPVSTESVAAPETPAPTEPVATEPAAPEAAASTQPAQPAQTPEPAQAAEPTVTPDSAPTAAPAPQQATEPTPAPQQALQQAAEPTPAPQPAPKTPKVEKKKPGKWGIQVGAFSNMNRAQTQAEKAQRAGHFDNTVVKVTQSNNIFRARIYGFQSNQQASQACRKLKTKNIQCLPVL